MSRPLPWSHRASDIAGAGSRIERAATPAELAAIARELDLLACDEVKARYTIRPLGEGRYRMWGHLSARVAQRCVVTLEPVEQAIEEDFDVAFWPEPPQAGDAEMEALTAPEIEPIEHGTIEAGRVLFETLAAALDPYPRKPGARFEWEQSADAAREVETGPFAGLKKLRQDR